MIGLYEPYFRACIVHGLAFLAWKAFSFSWHISLPGFSKVNGARMLGCRAAG